MKDNLANIPEVSIDKVDAFYVTGTQHRDAVGNTNNLKLNLKTLGGGVDLTDKEALMALWNALQDAITVVITEDDVEEHVEPGNPAIMYTVVNTEGFPDMSWSREKLPTFSPKVVGVFKNSVGTEVQVSKQLYYNASDVCWRGDVTETVVDLIPVFVGPEITAWRLMLYPKIS